VYDGSERMKLPRRGQVTLEFLFIFSLLTILLLYSINATTFRQGSPSVENLRMQVAVEEKGLANAISNTISQVYAQGPGSKATSYVSLVYLRNEDYLKKAWGISDPKIFITYGALSGASSANGTYVIVVNGSGITDAVLSGGNKNVFLSPSLFQKDLVSNSSVWNPDSSVTLNITGSSYSYHGLTIDPAALPSSLRIVVEWNPDNPDSWTYDSAKGELRININVGG